MSVQFLAILSLFQLRPVTLGVQILVTAPKLSGFGSDLFRHNYINVLAWILMLVLLVNTRVAWTVSSLSGGGFNQLKEVNYRVLTILY